MTTQRPDLTPSQLEWLRSVSPAFAKAYADVQRRDADVAKNRAMFEKPAFNPYRMVRLVERGKI